MTEEAVAVQPDGKIVVAGYTTASQIDVARYSANGSLDTTFGTNGVALLPVPTGSGQGVDRVLIQPDGKILVARDNDLARFTSSGTPDSSFGTGGLVTLSSVDRDLALQPDGKIVVLVGLTSEVLERFNSDGSVDRSFGSGGQVMLNPNQAEVVVALQTDGRIIVAGSQLDRFNPDGTIDSSFGTNGQVTLSVPAEAVAVQPDGRIVVAGSEQGFAMSLGRFDTNGSVDATFGSDGVAVIYTPNVPHEGGGVRKVLIQVDGKIVVDTDYIDTALTQPFNNSLLVRCNPNGTLDSTFGSVAPGVTVNNGLAGASGGAIAMQSDGKIVAVGTATGASQSGPMMIRYTADSPISDPNQRFLTQVYLDLLQRPVDPSGLASWSSALAAGTTRTQVVADIENSQEYRTLEVQYLYGFLLNRSADSAGMAGWVSFLNQGGTYEQLEAIFLGSNEYFAQRSGSTNAGFLQRMYDDLLQRPIDPSGASAWGQMLANGGARGAVAADILGSAESNADEVQALYHWTLRRGADGSGLNTFTTDLQNGASYEAIMATLAGSAEYFGLF